MPQSNNTIRCTIKRMFKNCPKPDGWFGCFAHIHGKSDDIKLTGSTTLPLIDGMIIDVVARENSENDYTAIQISPVTKTQQGLVSYLASMKNISRNAAKEIVNAAEWRNVDILDIIKNGHDSVRGFCNQAYIPLTDSQIDSLIDGVTRADIKNSLIQLLPEFGGSAKTIERICIFIKDNNITRPLDYIKDNPYCLVDVPGISFRTADDIAVRFGTDLFSDKRLGRVLEHLLRTDSSGDLYINLSNNDEYGRLYNRVQNELKIRYIDFNDFGARLLRVIDSNEYNICIDVYDSETHLYAKNVYDAMLTTAAMLWHTRQTANAASLISVNASSHPNATDINAYINHCISEYEIDVSIKKNINFSLNTEQKDAVRKALLNNMSVITGGPGRGKTSMIDCLAYCWKKMYQKSNILLLAPTGKAMNKLRNDTDSKYDTKTIDSVLVTIDHGRKFSHKTKKKYYNPYNSPHTLVIVDESSMIDIEKAANMFKAMPDCRYCFVGDADQLPPISPGAFFKDLIASNIPEIPVTYLVTPLRNSGTILDNAEKINNNDTNLKYNVTDMPFFPVKNDSQDALDLIFETYNDERSENPDITQIALLCPVKKGVIGSDNINIQIQNIVCQENTQPKFTKDRRRNKVVTTTKGFSIPDTFFGNSDNYTRLRVGDIVMNTKNNNEIESYHYKNDDYWNGDPVGTKSMGIFNGDCGRIIGYIPHEDTQSSDSDKAHAFMIIQMFDGRMVKLDITSGEADNIQLGYAMTVHKAQGCEYDSVIYISPERLLSFGTNGFLSKNLVYTAFTRAKKKVTVIGSKESLNLCIKSSIPDRNSNFKERISCAAPSHDVMNALDTQLFADADTYDKDHGPGI